jgi:hypothetical protein
VVAPAGRYSDAVISGTPAAGAELGRGAGFDSAGFSAVSGSG